MQPEYLLGSLLGPSMSSHWSQSQAFHVLAASSSPKRSPSFNSLLKLDFVCLELLSKFTSRLRFWHRSAALRKVGPQKICNHCQGRLWRRRVLHEKLRGPHRQTTRFLQLDQGGLTKAFQPASLDTASSSLGRLLLDIRNGTGGWEAKMWYSRWKPQREPSTL